MAEKFGNYEILRRIAAGGMAEVFLAKQKGLGGFERLVCIKRILPHLGVQEDFVKMFQDEARIAANLIHPNIAQIYDIGQFDGAYYIAMEYVRGEDLRRIYNQEVARGRAMPPEPAAQIVMGAAAGLDYAHRQTSIDGRPLGIVHRDISPQNILVTYDGHVKVVDFGVAKAAGKMTETRTGVLKGKYSYMSPEQASGDPIDARTDIFALGITLYEVTTGVRLFKRENEIETLHCVIECKVTPPSEILPGYEPELEEIVMRALSFDPDARFPTAGDMNQALERFLIGRGHPTGASSLGGYMADLFAEKLADELLFGGQVWDERLTPSAQRPSVRKSETSEPPAAEEVEQATSSTAALEAPSDDTVIEDAKSEPSAKSGPRRVARAPSARSSSAPKGHALDDWAHATGSASQTATHGPDQEAPHLAPAAEVAAPQARATAAKPPSRTSRKVINALLALVVVVFGFGIGARMLAQRGAKVPRSGELVIESEPRGARVTFTGLGADELNRRYDLKGYRTPFTIAEGVPVTGGIRARFIKDGYEVAELALPAMRAGVVPEPLFAELALNDEKAQTATLILISSPPGAEVVIDGEPREGKTPLDDVRVRGGETHKVELLLAGYEPYAESFYLEPGSRKFVEKLLVRAAAQKPRPAPDDGEGPDRADGHKKPGRHDGDGARAYLSVTAPMKLRVTVGNRYVGETPIRKLAVDAGQQRIKLESESEGFTLRRKVKLSAGGTESVDVQPDKGFLSIQATPWAFVRIGKGQKLETPVRVQVYEGEYTLAFECPDGKKKVHDARVAARGEAAVSVSCRD